MNQMNKKIVMLVANDCQFDSRVLKEATSAAKAGFGVTIIARKSLETTFEEEKAGFKIVRVQTFLDKIWARISSSHGREIAGSQSAGAPKSLVIYAALLNTYLLNLLFARLAKKIKPDLVHANDATSLMAGLILKKDGAKLVYDSHELYTEQLEKPHPLWKWFFTKLEKRLPQADAIFSVNQSILDELTRRYHLKNIPQEILYNTPPYYQNYPSKPTYPIKLLYLGHAMSGRGIETMIQAVHLLKNVELTIFGSGFNLQDKKIKVNKPIPQDQLIRQIPKYDIGILPYVATSLNNRYSTPNKLFEYMMGGLAVAASDLPEVSRIIKKADSGVLFNPTDPKDIAAKIQTLIKDLTKLNQKKANSLKMARHYCWEKQEEKQLKIYRKLLSE